MTLEACFVLPFFLFAVLNVISIIDVFRIQGDMSAAMHDTGKTMAVYAYEYMVVTDELLGEDEDEESTMDWFESMVLAHTYAKETVKNRLGDIYPEDAYWYRSSILKGDDMIDLVAIYSVEPPISLMGYGRQHMHNRLRTRAWTGYDNTLAQDDGESDDEIVYVTETGTVYHLHRGCTYLKLSISAVPKESLPEKKNSGGSTYTGCESCGQKAGNTVYITNHGHRYHSTLRCSKLKRTISAVPISQVGNMKSCSKCGG